MLAALREVYDGSWTRHVGTDGGRSCHWAGKCGLIAGCTPTIDRHHAVMGAMGERFVLYRLPEVSDTAQARRSLEHVGREAEMRRELQDVVTRAIRRKRDCPSGPPDTSDADRERLIALSHVRRQARSAVERDGYTREIELIPQSESPARLVVVLARMLSALRCIGVTEADAWQVTMRLGLDSIPAIRRSMIEHLADRQGLGADGGDR